MKFGKVLETNAESLPEDWRPYVIQYKSLKKKISAIVKELDDRGLPSPTIKTLLAQTMTGEVHRLEYSIDEDQEHVKTYIRVVLDDNNHLEDLNGLNFDSILQDEQLSKLLAHELHLHNKSMPPPSVDKGSTEIDDLTGEKNSTLYSTESNESQKSQSSQATSKDSASVPSISTSHCESSPIPQDKKTLPESEIVELLSTPGALKELQSISINNEAGNNTRVETLDGDGKRVLVIELTEDTAFFDQLGEEVSQLSKLQQASKHNFESKVEELSRILTVVSSPHNKDMYTWREILKTYLDAQVFVGDYEADRATRTSENAQKQLQWFLQEMERSKLIHKFKLPKSKSAFSTFFQLNAELVQMTQFKELNQMAMTKILKKHDKRTNLSASSGYPRYLQNEPFYNDNISRSLTYTIGNQLISIIPQPDDYSCPICMSVAWKPIRLKCHHVFCVRCLIKAQRKNMLHCPICRDTNSVKSADASNLDVSMMNFLKLYFPKEIKEKRKESNREQAAEEMEAFTGQRWSQADPNCVIM
ncbi:hypothetical protein BGZ76_004313 [Entomortierella beljakovae]|nr:hypothetical protein BGZ76_004313 [Entomortierella beljakovae]